MHRHRTVRCLLNLVIMAIALLFAGVNSSAAEDLPEAMTILLKNIEASGGFAAYQQIHNMKIAFTGETAWNNKNEEPRPLSMESTIYQEKPNRYYEFQRAELPDGSRIKREYGTDGSVVWKMLSIDKSYPQTWIIKGRERINILVGWHFPFDLQQSPYKSFKTVGVKAIDGRTCDEVIMEPTEGDPRTAWYDKNDFSLVAIQLNGGALLSGNASVQPILTKFYDYRKVNGVMMPHKIVSTVMGWGTDDYPNRTIITIKSIEMNIAMPKNRFALPPLIKARLKSENTGNTVVD